MIGDILIEGGGGGGLDCPELWGMMQRSHSTPELSHDCLTFTANSRWEMRC